MLHDTAAIQARSILSIAMRKEHWHLVPLGNVILPPANFFLRIRSGFNFDARLRCPDVRHASGHGGRQLNVDIGKLRANEHRELVVGVATNCPRRPMDEAE